MSPCESQELGSCLGTHTKDGTAFSFLNAYMHAQKRKWSTNPSSYVTGKTILEFDWSGELLKQETQTLLLTLKCKQVEGFKFLVLFS